MFLRLRNWQPWLTCIGMVSLVTFQAWAFYDHLTLSLGPRVILQPWLLDQGYIEYENIVDIHTPLVPIILAILRFLVPDGYSLAKLTLVALIALMCILSFIAGRRKAGWWAGLWASFFFVLWSPVFGMQKLWYEVFLGPIYLVWFASFDATEKPRTTWILLFWGFLGGIAVLIKQQAVVVFALFLIWHIVFCQVQRRQWVATLREAVIMGLAAFTPFLVYSIYQIARAGTLTSFLYWTLIYEFTSDYKTLAALSPTSAQLGWLFSSGVLLPVALFCLIHAWRKRNPTWMQFGVGLSLMLASCFSIYPRFELFHLAATLPLLAVVSSMTLAYLWRIKRHVRWAVLVGALLLSGYWLATTGAHYQQIVTSEEPIYIYEYSDLVPLARQVQDIVPAEASIYLFPDDESTSNLYYLLQKKTPDFWIFYYPWNLLDWTKVKILDTLTRNPPDWIIYFPGHTDTEHQTQDIVSYFQTHYQRMSILQWSDGEVWLLKRTE
jgi:hypothetical protein